MRGPDEAHYREVFGTPTSFAAVVQEQRALRLAGLPWAPPTRLTTVAPEAHVMAFSAAAFPVFRGATPSSVLQDMASRQATVMAQLRSAKADEAAAARRREAAASARAPSPAGHSAPQVLSPGQPPPASAQSPLTVASAGPESSPLARALLEGTEKPADSPAARVSPPGSSGSPTAPGPVAGAAQQDASSTDAPDTAPGGTTKRPAPVPDPVEESCSPAKQRKGPARAAKAVTGAHNPPTAAPKRAARSRAPTPDAFDEASTPSS